MFFRWRIRSRNRRQGSTVHWRERWDLCDCRTHLPQVKATSATDECSKRECYVIWGLSAKLQSLGPIWQAVGSTGDFSKLWINMLHHLPTIFFKKKKNHLSSLRLVVSFCMILWPFIRWWVFWLQQKWIPLITPLFLFMILNYLFFC